MKVTTRGRVTIPRDIRDKEGIVPGCAVEFLAEGDRICLRKVEGQGRGRPLTSRARGRGSVKMTTDEILALTRGDRSRDRFPVRPG